MAGQGLGHAERDVATASVPSRKLLKDLAENQPHAGGPGGEPGRLAGAKTLGDLRETAPKPAASAIQHRGSTAWTATEAVPVLWHQKETFGEMSRRALPCLWLCPSRGSPSCVPGQGQALLPPPQAPSFEGCSSQRIPRDLLSDPKGSRWASWVGWGSSCTWLGEGGSGVSSRKGKDPASSWGSCRCHAAKDGIKMLKLLPTQGLFWPLIWGLGEQEGEWREAPLWPDP